MKKNIIVVTFLVFLVSIGIAILYKYNLNKKKAINLAEEYIEQTYGFIPKYQHCRCTLIDPAQFYVTVEHNNLLFNVKVPFNLDMPKITTYANKIYLPDNYIQNKFAFQLADNLHRLSNGKFNGEILVINNPNYSYVLSKNIKSNMDYNDIEKYFEYNIYYDMNSSDVNTEAKIIGDIIETIKEKKYTPNDFIVRANVENKDRYIHFEKINDIHNMEDIIDILLKEHT